MWPSDSNIRIVPNDSPFGFRSVERGLLVLNFAIIGKRQKAMSKAHRHIQKGFIFRRQLEAEPLSEGSRTALKVDRHVKDSPHGTPHQFGHRCRTVLVVHTPQHSAG